MFEGAARSLDDRSKVAPRPFASPKSRSRLTNGKMLDADRRTASYRRFRDLVAGLVAELGVDEPTISELSTVRAAAALIVKGEQLQAGIVRGDSVAADEVVRLASEARRLLTGLQRRRDRKRDAEQPDLQTYLAEHYGEPAGEEPQDAREAGGRGSTASSPRNAPYGRPGERRRASYGPTSTPDDGEA
jgi:hypothetical protein